MTDNNHPIIPPQELMQQWLGNYFGNVFNGELSDLEKYLVTQASQWGYEQRGADIEYELQKARDEELEACCEWLKKGWIPAGISSDLRTARRPLSLKEQALAVLDDASDRLDAAHENIIRRALEQLDD
jgi:hypothetical protein